MKIDFYISSLSGGGAEKVLLTLARGLACRGNQVSVTSLEKRPQFYDVPEGVEVIKIDHSGRKWWMEMLLDMKAIKSQIKKRRSDAVISFLSRCNLLVLMGAMFLPGRVVVCDRNNPLREHSKKVFLLSCFLYRRADAVVVQTNEIKGMYPKFLQNKIYVIENPLDTEALERQLTGQEDRRPVVVSIGRLEPQKDFRTLITAFAKLADRFPEWNLEIYGKGYMQEELKQYIAQLHMEQRIFICGSTNKPVQVMKCSKIFVLSTNYEGFPNVLCEAMFAGAACISTDCVSGPRELICDGENGLLVKVGDVVQMQRALERLMSDEKLCIQYGGHAQEAVKRLYLKNILDKWAALLERLQAGKR